MWPLDGARRPQVASRRLRGQRERRVPAREPAENDAALPPLLVE